MDDLERLLDCLEMICENAIEAYYDVHEGTAPRTLFAQQK